MTNLSLSLFLPLTQVQFPGVHVAADILDLSTLKEGTPFVNVDGRSIYALLRIARASIL
jgi:hypothetical protein